MAIVRTSKNRQTKTPISLIDNRDESFDVGGQPWITLCEKHGNYCEHETRALAESLAPVPAEWCPECDKYANADPHWCSEFPDQWCPVCAFADVLDSCKPFKLDSPSTVPFPGCLTRIPKLDIMLP